MSRSAALLTVSVIVALLLLEACCRLDLISAFTIIPPSQMFVGLYQLLASGQLYPDIRSTFVAVTVAAAASIAFGLIFGAVIHAAPRVRTTLDPIFASYYAIPIWVFYPLFIFTFGLTESPKIIIGYLYAVVAMIVNVMNGLDRVPRVLLKTAKVYGLSPGKTLFYITLPAVLPYIFTGVKLAISYAFIGVVASEFIMATSGVGYRISWAYTSFDNRLLYSTILLVILVSIAINATLGAWERGIMQRRGLE